MRFSWCRSSAARSSSNIDENRVTVQLGVPVTVDLDKVVTPYKGAGGRAELRGTQAPLLSPAVTLWSPVVIGLAACKNREKRSASSPDNHGAGWPGLVPTRL
ncbi:hypothetical protein EN813_010025 [Mesorhizobium sp. M00.F.Ca.ET.170.01.1.1]|nr:hypothetical protein EN813_010025 [Mesorhizobium sp. M00.F.Ca.ET.170.01.1.1]